MDKFNKILDSYVAKRISKFKVRKFTAKSNFARAKFVMNMIRKHDPFPAICPSQKDEYSSKILILVGNNHLGLHNFSYALENFNKAIMLAPANSLSYIEGLQKRSECLISMGFHDKALLSVQQALKCSGIELYKKEPERQMNVCEELAVSSSSSDARSCPNVALLFNRNEYLTSASNKVEMSTNTNVGRLLKATADIRTGEVIVIEEPYARVINPKFRFTHCWNCTKYCMDLNPCTKCSQAMFCSQNCLEEAKKFHDFECAMMDLLIFELGVPELYLLAFRMFLIATEHGTKLNELKQKVDNIDAELENSKTYDSNDFIRICTLWYDPTRKSANFYFYLTFLAGYIVFALIKYTNLFEDTSSDLEVFACNLLLRFFLIAECNAQTFTAMGLQGGCLLHVGGAIFPTFSLFNHSCDPNIVRCFFNQTLVVRAVKFIKAGEELNICYNSYFATNSFSDRQAQLEQYNFTCRCRACEYDWPMYPSQLSTLPELKKTMDDTTRTRYSDLCNDFSATFQFEWKDEDIQLVNKVEFTPEIINWLCEFVDLTAEYVDSPHKQYTEALKALTRGFGCVPGFQRSSDTTEDTDAAAPQNE